ncbi:hypothetical protein E2I00_005101, partial [Balaenoptera physalus]
AGATAANAVFRWAGSRPNSLNLRSPGPPARRGGGSASPTPRCQRFAEACPAGRSRSRDPARLGTLDPGQTLPPTRSAANPVTARSPTLHQATRRGRGHVRRARGTNGHLARNGRDCLTPMTSQSWRGARRSSAPTRRAAAHSRMCVCPGPRRIGIPVRSSSLPLFS